MLARIPHRLAARPDEQTGLVSRLGAGPESGRGYLEARLGEGLEGFQISVALPADVDVGPSRCGPHLRGFRSAAKTAVRLLREPSEWLGRG